MKFILRTCAPLLVCAVLTAAPSHTVSAAEAARATNAWVRSTVAGQTTAGAYMELTGNVDAVLMAVDSPLAGKVQLHSMSMDGGVMRMRALEKIDLPAGKTVKLAPGGLHVMLYDIKQPFAAGGTVPLTLTFMSAGGAKSTLKLDAQVRAAGAGAEHRH